MKDLVQVFELEKIDQLESGPRIERNRFPNGFLSAVLRWLLRQRSRIMAGAM